MKSCMQWNPVYSWKGFHLRQGSNLGPLAQLTSSQPTELLGLLREFEQKV